MSTKGKTIKNTGRTEEETVSSRESTRKNAGVNNVRQNFHSERSIRKVADKVVSWKLIPLTPAALKAMTKGDREAFFVPLGADSEVSKSSYTASQTHRTTGEGCYSRRAFQSS